MAPRHSVAMRVVRPIEASKVLRPECAVPRCQRMIGALRRRAAVHCMVVCGASSRERSKGNAPPQAGTRDAAWTVSTPPKAYGGLVEDWTEGLVGGLAEARTVR